MLTRPEEEEEEQQQQMELDDEEADYNDELIYCNNDSSIPKAPIFPDNFTSYFDTFIPRITSSLHIAKIVGSCRFCGIERFSSERKGWCCANGKYVTHLLTKIPDQLVQLYSVHGFSKLSRYVNNQFAICSYQFEKGSIHRAGGFVEYLPENIKDSGDFYCKINGDMYHNIHGPFSNQGYLKYLVNDPVTRKFELEKKGGLNNAQHQQLQLAIDQVDEVLQEISPIVRDFVTASEIAEENDVENFRLEIGYEGNSRDVSILYKDVNEPYEDYKIAIRFKDTGYKQIHRWNKFYEAGMYPLLFPYGVQGMFYEANKPVSQRYLFSTSGEKLTMPFYLRQTYLRNPQFALCGRSSSIWLIDNCIRAQSKKLYFYENANKNGKFSSTVKDVKDYLQKKRQRGRGRNRGSDGRERNSPDFNQFALTRREEREVENESDRVMTNLISDETIQSEGYIPGKIYLSSKFEGSNRYYRQKKADAFYICSKLGTPTYFVTFTANPKWKLIQDKLFPGQTYHDRPILVARVFNSKLNELLKLIRNGSVFGGNKSNSSGKAIVYDFCVVEFQKRGLPHAHILFRIKGEQPRFHDHIDKFVQATLPDPTTNPTDYHLVKNHMLHGGGKTCDHCKRYKWNAEDTPNDHPTCRCAKCRRKRFIDAYKPRPFHRASKRCDKYFPAPLIEQTTFTDTGRTKYKRLKDIDRYVVPYNIHLLRKFDCHINVQLVEKTQVVDYLFKYIYKGHNDKVKVAQEMYNLTDQETEQLKEDLKNDEVKAFWYYNSLSACHASYKSLGFRLMRRNPDVKVLPVHDDGEDWINFNLNEKDLQTAIENKFQSLRGTSIDLKPQNFKA